ncbi:hypothetical protein H5410_052353, partial [Solanum commersonii]
DLDDVPLSVLHPQKPRRRRKHIGVKQISLRTPFHSQCKIGKEKYLRTKPVLRGIGHALENKEPIDWPSVMIKHMSRIINPQPGSHQLSYGNLLTMVLKTFVAPLGKERTLTHADMFTRSSLGECGLLAEPDQVPIASSRVPGPVAILLHDLRTIRDQLAIFHAKNASLCADLLTSQGEVTKLQEQLVQ